MAEVNQIYSLINEIASQSLGEKAVAVVDGRTLTSLGDVVLSSQTDKEKFYNALVDRIGRTIIAVRDYEPKARSIMRSEFDFGIILQKISYEMGKMKADGGWNIPLVESGESANAPVNPYSVYPNAKAVQKLFKVISAWEYDEVIPDFQLKTAFADAQKMASFISGIYVTMSNAMALSLENAGNIAVATTMANIKVKATATSGNTNCYRNLLNEYNTKVLGLTWNGTGDAPTGWLKVDGALTDKDFLKFVSRELSLLVEHMRTFSKAFNVEKFERHTPTDKCVVEVLEHVSSACAYYLESDTYHNNLVKLPAYESRSYWQGSGTDFGFADCSKVICKTGNGSGTNTTLTGVIAFVHDYDGVAVSMYDRRMHTLYNPANEVTNVFNKANIGYAIDLSENGVVFYIADPTA